MKGREMSDFEFKGHYFNREEWLGINGESFAVHVLKAIIGKNPLTVLHQDWFSHYNYGEGSDFKIADSEFNVLVEGEVKNWKHQNRPYGTEIAKEEILPRYTTQAPIKLLIITYLSLLTQKALELLRQHNITVIEVSGLIVKATKNQLFKPLLRKLYPILKPLLEKAKPHRKISKNNKDLKLTNYCQHNRNNKHITNNTIKNTHDTTIRNSIILGVYLGISQPDSKVKQGSSDYG